LLDRANFANQIAAFGNQVAAGLDFERDLVTEAIFGAFAAASTTK
jgi:hypothetical protein